MTETERGEFARVLHALAAIKGKELTADILALWWGCLSDWPLVEFKQAASHLLKHGGPYMPQPADFIALRKAGAQTAGEAWAKVLAEVRRSGRGPIDPATDKAVAELGGYERVAMCSDERLGYLERAFFDNYEDGATVEEARAALPAGVRRLK